MVYNHPATVAQFLGIQQGDQAPPGWEGEYTETEKINKGAELRGDIYYIKDPSHNTIHKAVTLDIFKDMKFDIIISSIPAHINRFNKLIAEFQPGAKHIFQVGNAWGHQGGVQNILASTAPFSTPKGINTCFYHQEFDLNVFKYEPPVNTNVVNSYVHYMRNTDLMNQVASYLPHWRFNTYGAGMQASLPGAQPVADALKQSTWTWHWKPEGDGYGHSIFSSYACGRPAIIWGDQYQGKLASSLFIDGVTCLDGRGKSPQEIAAILARKSTPDRVFKMCELAYEQFKKVVDFDAEFITIKAFLERLL
jgi:hypothetical protein